eukprot:GHVO01024566.1.p1 GENE.GHVO01024566.1~~GHVO01024566.1.p1  ORF type:complete len:333 (+),score=5.79 GHVO01024566.1:95-1000(+)
MGKERKKSATINCLFMLAIADTLVLLMYGFILIPIGLRKYLIGWWSGHNYNHITLTYFTEVSRIFNQVSAFITMLVTFQRYVSVCLPHRAKQLCSVRQVNIVTAVSYIVSILFFLPNFFIYVIERNPETNRYQQVSLPLAYSTSFQILHSTLATGLITYVIPVSTLSFMSVQILRTMREQSKVVQQSSERNQAHKDLTKSSIAIVALFILCQSFYLVYRVLMWVYDPYFKYSRCGGSLQFFAFTPFVTMVINSASNFLIYVILAKGFRKKVMLLFAAKNKVVPINIRLGDTKASVPADTVN